MAAISKHVRHTEATKYFLQQTCTTSFITYKTIINAEIHFSEYGTQKHNVSLTS